MIKIEIERETGMVYLDKTLLGRDKENLQEMLYFTFRDGIFNGTGRLEYKLPNGESHFVLLETNGIDYYLPIKNVLLENGHIEMQFVLTESETEEGIPVFKSNIFTLYCKESINAVEEQPSDYELWIETANAKLAEMDNLNVEAVRETSSAVIKVTDKEGVTTNTVVYDGAKGDKGDKGDTGTTDYEEQENKPVLNGKTIIGNQTLEYYNIADLTTLNTKQASNDDNLQTDSKNITGAINELNTIAKQTNLAKGYTNYQSLITELNSASKNDYNVGQSFLIQTLNIPDLWVISIENTSQQYTYTTDEAFITATGQSGGVQVGYYKLGQLETLKQDLTNYVTNTDYATQNVAGVIKLTSSYGTQLASDKKLRATIVDYSDYGNLHNNAFIGKQTLENVFIGKGLVLSTTISDTSTNSTIPTSKSVYDYVSGLDGNNDLF